MKKIIILLVTLSSLTVAGVAAGNAIMNSKTENPNAEFAYEENVQLNIDNNQVLEELKTEKQQGSDIDYEAMSYAYFISVLEPTDAEKLYIDGLILKGYDIDSLVRIFEFWQYTNEDISIIETVYNSKPEDLEQNQYWVEDAFVALSQQGKTKNAFTSLTYDEVKEYNNNGLSFDEIRAADKLSRKGVKETKAILQEKQDGKSWYEIADEIYDISADKTKEKEKFKEIKSANEVLSCVRLGKKDKGSIKSHLNKVLEGQSAVEKEQKINSEKIKNADKQLTKQKIIDGTSKKGAAQ